MCVDLISQINGVCLAQVVVCVLIIPKQPILSQTLHLSSTSHLIHHPRPRTPKKMKPKKEKKPEESHEQVSEAVTWMLVGYIRYAYALAPKYAPKYASNPISPRAH